MRFRSGLSIPAFLIASVLNPGYFAGCATGDDEAKYQYGAAEMTTLALAANDSFEVVRADGVYRIDLEVEPERAATARLTTSAHESAWATRAHACGDRQLVATASACIDSSSMLVSGKLTLLRANAAGDFEVIASDVAVSGSLWATLSLNHAMLDLTFVGGRLGLVTPDARSFEVRDEDLSALID